MKRSNIVDEHINKESIKELIRWIVVSVVLLVVVEFLSRGNMGEVKLYFSDRTKSACINLLLIMIFTGLTFFMKRKKAGLWIISCIILGVAFINYFILIARGMPIAFSDVFSISDGLSIASQFIDMKMVIAVAVAILVFIIVTIVLWRMDKNSKRITGFSNIVIFVLVLCVMNGTKDIRKSPYMAKMGWDITLTYENNGFVYSFVDSYFGYLRKAPDGYSKEAIEKIKNEVEKRASEDKTAKTDKKPNIMFVQLEGFMDPKTIPGVEFNMNPVPTFNELSEKYTSGYMNVSTTGGGTARTEFEVYTGNSFNYLIAGEIPYMTILNSRQENSIATYMRSIGYKTHVIHNFEGNFYNRNKGLENLGFETFTSHEYMNGIEKTPMGWPKDVVLTDYINKALDSSEGSDLVCTISAQGHAPYPADRLDENWPCKLTKTGDLTETQQKELEYYAEQARGMDTFIKELNESLEKRKQETGEDTIVVYYGDHMPNITYLFEGDEILPRYKAPYTFYATFDIEKENLSDEFSAYQLSTKLFEYSGVGYGVMEKFHRYMSNDENYQEMLELVEYDMLFGKEYYISEDEKQGENTIKMGLDEISIDSIKQNGDKIIITGKNMTPKCTVFIDGEKVESEFISPEKIEVKGNITSGAEVQLKLLGKYDAELSSTEIYKYK